MITSPAFSGRKYAVLGLARSGLATVRALLASGASVVAWDDGSRAREALAGDCRQEGGDRLAITDFTGFDNLDGVDAIVVSPGVPINSHPIAAKARAVGVPLIGDIQLFADSGAGWPPRKVVGITGTNGKSTTTALLLHMLQTAHIPSIMAGNIGEPIMAQSPLPQDGVYVLELSSYQIDLTYSLDCDVAVLLNITPDHLDRYESFEAYAASKMRLFEMQSSDHVAILGFDDPEVHGRVIPLWFKHDADHLIMATGRDLDQSRWPALKGPHNAQNAAVAMAAARILGVSEGAIERALETYRALPHRMETVAEKGGVLFVNDSKATNPESAAPALGAYPDIHWIVGGRPKSEDLAACAPYLGRVRAAYTIGEAGPMFANWLSNKVPVVEHSITLEDAVRNAARFAKPGEVVLLSPACASFDQFRDYEARGDAFRAAVEALA